MSKIVQRKRIFGKIHCQFEPAGGGRFLGQALKSRFFSVAWATSVAQNLDFPYSV